jgi:hypothetical protein
MTLELSVCTMTSYSMFVVNSGAATVTSDASIVVLPAFPTARAKARVNAAVSAAVPAIEEAIAGSVVLMSHMIAIVDCSCRGLSIATNSSRRRRPAITRSCETAESSTPSA